MPRIQELPAELVLAFLRYLVALPDIQASARVCRYWAGCLAHPSIRRSLELVWLGPRRGTDRDHRAEWLFPRELAERVPTLDRVLKVYAWGLPELRVEHNINATIWRALTLCTTLQDLILGCNQLVALPPEIGRLTALNPLALDNNQLAALPTEILALGPHVVHR